MLASAASAALDIMEDNLEMFEDLKQKAELVHDTFDNLKGLELFGDRISPIKHLRTKKSNLARNEQKNLLRKIGAKVTIYLLLHCRFEIIHSNFSGS